MPATAKLRLYQPMLDLPAYANGQRFLSKGGPGGGFYGFQVALPRRADVRLPRLHADLIILAKLACALVRARAVFLAA